MQRVVVSVLVLVCAACAAPPDSVPAPTVDRLELNVVVEQDWVTVHVREPDRPCRCTTGQFPQVGECVTTTDEIRCSCSPGPGSCLEEVWVQRNGSIETWQRWQDVDFSSVGLLNLSVPGALEGGYSIMLRGCGGEAEIPVPPMEAPAPRITSIQDNGQDLLIEWRSAPQAESAQVWASFGLGGISCHSTDPAVYLEGYGDPDVTVTVGVMAFGERREVRTGLGIATLRGCGLVSSLDGEE